MTLEFEKAPLAGGINLNSSYTVHEFQDFGVTSKSSPKKFSISKKEGLGSVQNIEKGANMSAKYSDDYDSYDEDFENSTPEPRNSSRYSRARSRSPNVPKKSSSRAVGSRTRNRRDSFASYRSAYGTLNYSRGPPKRGKKSTYSATSKTTHKSHGDGKMIHRVLSASRNRVTRLHNIVEELQRESNELRKDNRTLKRVNQRQERDLRKAEGEEAELPILLERHSAEMRSLRERLRRNQDILRKREKDSLQQDSEILKLRDRVKELRSLAENKRLGERNALAKKLESMETDATEKDKKIVDLEKALALKDKVKQRELKEQHDKYKKTKSELQKLREDFEGLRMRLQDKEKELDEKNIYHQHIKQKKKKGQPLALPMAPSPPRDQRSVANESKRPNVFLTNASYGDSASQVSEASPRDAVVSEKPVTSVLEESALERGLETERRETELAENARRRQEEDERKKREEEERKREDERKKEERRKREEEEERERKRREEEEERIRREKEIEEQKRLQEEAEIRRKKDLLLARMRQIDNENEGVKANEEIFSTPKETAPKPSKLPIFLQSSNPQQSNEATINKEKDSAIKAENSSDKKSPASSGRSRYSYEFKQTVENLHHGLPAHASDEQKRLAGAKIDTEGDASFGAYKPTFGRRGRKASKSDTDDNNGGFVFGGYAPSVTDKGKLERKNSGLNFSQPKKSEPPKPAEESAFGSYNPSFGGARPRRNSGQGLSDEDPFSTGLARKPQNRRRSRGDNSTFGEDLFGLSGPPQPAKASVFGDDIFEASKDTSKDQNYPWENRVDTSSSWKANGNASDSLLPRRKRLQQGSFGSGPQQNVRVVGNALDDVEDEIEELIL